MPTEIEEWVDSAISGLNVNARKLPEEESTKVLATLTTRFLSERTQMWWWTVLKAQPTVVGTEGVTLNAILPSREGLGFLVAGTEDFREPVYHLHLADMGRVIAECPFFEYCVSGQDLDWLVIESHHNEFYILNSAEPRVEPPARGSGTEAGQSKGAL